MYCEKKHISAHLRNGYKIGAIHEKDKQKGFVFRVVLYSDLTTLVLVKSGGEKRSFKSAKALHNFLAEYSEDPQAVLLNTLREFKNRP